MEKTDIWQECTTVFRDLFDNGQLVIGPETTASNVEGWDSIKHIELIVTLEQKFGIRFRTGEMARLKNVGEMVDMIAAIRERSNRR
jgi:acyl carrier protein